MSLRDSLTVKLAASTPVCTCHLRLVVKIAFLTPFFFNFYKSISFLLFQTFLLCTYIILYILFMMTSVVADGARGTRDRVQPQTSHTSQPQKQIQVGITSILANKVYGTFPHMATETAMESHGNKLSRGQKYSSIYRGSISNIHSKRFIGTLLLFFPLCRPQQNRFVWLRSLTKTMQILKARSNR